MMRQYLPVILILLLLGCVSPKLDSESVTQGSTLQEKYEQLQLENQQLQIENEKLNTDYEQVQLDQESMKSSGQGLATEMQNKNIEYKNLNASYKDLKNIYDNLVLKYNKLQDDYRDLEYNKIEVDSIRLPKDIPTSPSIPGIDFVLTKESIILKHDRLNLSSVTDTKSMLQTISADHSAIFTNKFDAEKLEVGNIIAYDSGEYDLPIMHRIIEVDSDSNGVCYIVQGDNNLSPDPGCVKPSQVLGLVIGIVFNKNSEGYGYCNGDTIPIIKDDIIYCMSNVVPAGIYTEDQILPSSNFSIFSFCSENQQNKPYTVITPDGEVYCYKDV